MSEPNTPDQLNPEVPDPFGSAPLRPAGSAGCGKPLLIGCGAVLVLLGIAFVFFLFKAKDVVGWAFSQMEVSVMENLPEDITDEEVARLETAFEAATRAVVSGKADTLAFQELQNELMGLSARIESLSREDVLSLIEVLERFAGIESDAPPEEALPPPAEAEEIGLTSA